MLSPDLLRIDNYYDLNREFSQSGLQVREGTELRLYQSVEHALAELTQGLAQIYPHRSDLIYYQGMSPFYQRPMLSAARRGLNVRGGTFAELCDPKFLASHLTKTSLLVAYNLDDPLTGRLFKTDFIEPALAGKSVFRLQICHSLHFLRTPFTEVGPYQIQIQALPGFGAVALLGKNVRSTATMGPFLRWPICMPAEFRGVADSLVAQDQEVISAFERAAPSGGRALLSGIHERLWDRAVLSWSDVDGSAIVAALARERGWDLATQEHRRWAETASLCRWRSLDYTDWLEQQGWDLAQRRGLVVIARELVEDPQLPEQLERVITILRSAQEVLI